jgi:phage shock protein C
MQASDTALPLRDDTLLGVCEALGEDLHFNPLWLRIALAGLLLWNPVAVVSFYLAAGILVAVSRWLYPRPRTQRIPEAAEPPRDLAIAA